MAPFFLICFLQVVATMFFNSRVVKSYAPDELKNCDGRESCHKPAPKEPCSSMLGLGAGI